MVKGGKISAKDGIAKVEYKAEVDGDADGRASAGAEITVFVDVPELMDESLKDNATAQVLAKWFDANKMLLPAIEKAI